ncbi:MAG: DUF4397 domain-containing protein [Thermomicrobiales bacterium]|nr:DUF4397 domain-containing protein [Thermomicrobiales bacterium]
MRTRTPLIAYATCLLLALLPAAAWIAPATVDARQEEGPVTRTTVRFVNAVPGSEPLAISIDGAAVIEGAEFGTVSETLTVEPGKRAIDATAAGVSATGEPNLDEGASYIITFLGQIGDIGVKVNEVKLTALEPGKIRVRAIHASPDAGELDIRVAGGDELFENVAFEEDTEYREMDAGSYQFEALDDDDAALGSLPVDIQSGRVVDLVALGVVSGGTFAVVPIVTNVSPPCSEILGAGSPDDACVRFVHGQPALGNADAAVGGNVIADDLPFGEATDFVSIHAEKDLAFTLLPAGGDGAPVAPLTYSLKAGQAYVAVAWSDTEDADATAEAIENTRIDLYEIDLTPLPAEQARLRLIQTAGDAGEIDLIVPSLGDDADLFTGVGEGKASRYEVLDSGDYPLEVHYAGEVAALFETGLTLESGAVYDVVALGNVEDESFMLLVLTAPSDSRDDAATPVGPPPGATPARPDAATPSSG